MTHAYHHGVEHRNPHDGIARRNDRIDRFGAPVEPIQEEQM
jgi:hypothetical protein